MASACTVASIFCRLIKRTLNQPQRQTSPHKLFHFGWLVSQPRFWDVKAESRDGIALARENLWSERMSCIVRSITKSRWWSRPRPAFQEEFPLKNTGRCYACFGLAAKETTFFHNRIEPKSLDPGSMKGDDLKFPGGYVVLLGGESEIEIIFGKWEEY